MIAPYLELVTSQHANKDKFMRWLSTYLEMGDAAKSVANAIPDAFDINQAGGVNLEVLGDQVGRERILPFQLSDGTNPVLDDQNYRIALKAKIARNQWDGTIPQIYELWNTLFPEARLRIKDNQDMSMLATIRGVLGLQSVQLVTVGYILPKPTGVQLDIKWESELTRTDYVGMAVTTRDTIVINCAAPY